MIKSISNTQLSANKSKASFGSANYFNMSPFFMKFQQSIELPPLQENKTMLNLFKKVTKGEFELLEVKPHSKIFKAQNGDTLEVNQAIKDSFPSIALISNDKKEGIQIIKDEKMKQTVRQVYDFLVNTLEDIALPNK